MRDLGECMLPDERGGAKTLEHAETVTGVFN